MTEIANHSPETSVTETANYSPKLLSFPLWTHPPLQIQVACDRVLTTETPEIQSLPSLAHKSFFLCDMLHSAPFGINAHGDLEVMS